MSVNWDLFTVSMFFWCMFGCIRFKEVTETGQDPDELHLIWWFWFSFSPVIWALTICIIAALAWQAAWAEIVRAVKDLNREET